MVSSAAICLLLSRPHPSEGRSCWYNTYTYIDEIITIHMSTCEGERRISNRYETSLTLFNTFTKDGFNYVLDSLYRWIEMTKGELS